MPIVAKDLGFGYPQRPHLFNGLHFEVSTGECLAIVAPSGRGKSTLLKLIGGYLRPTKGTISIDGLPAEKARTELTWVFQSSTLMPQRSVLDNVALPLLARGFQRDEAEATAASTLTHVGLDNHVYRRANSLSGGEAQRASVARALAWPGRGILADEPTANLDRANASVVVTALLSNPASQPVILVTHDPEIAGQATRTLHLDADRSWFS